MKIERVSAELLARRFGTPLYVYSKAAVIKRFGRLRIAFIARSSARSPLICYAMKANSNRSICRVLAREGAGADIVSGGELLRALAAGFRPERIVFSGVGKTQDEMALALRRRLLTLNVESAAELDALEKVARRLKIPAPVSIRLNPDVHAGAHPHIATGRAADKFGVDRAQALALYLRAAKSPWLSVRGIQCHIGSQITSAKPYAQAAQGVASLIKELAGRGIALKQADFGGGLGVPYRGEAELPVDRLASVLEQALKPWPRMRLLLEPGRYLVADAGLLLARVLYVKNTKARRFVIVDAAMNDLARPSLYDAYHPIVPVGEAKGKLTAADVVGPVCESGDYLARNRPLPPLEAGDLLAVQKTGAYGFAMSSQYNSRPRAAEVLVEGARARLIRLRETIADLVRHEL